MPAALPCPGSPGRRRLGTLRGSGDVVDEEALTEALRNNKLAGAYLDVFAHEPLGADSELWALPNTIVSPHSAAHSSGNYERALDIFLRNAQLWAQGKPLINLAL